MNRYIAKILAHISLIVMIVVIMQSCQDEFIYDPGVVPDGDVELSGQITFRPLVETINNQASRSGETTMTGTSAPNDEAFLAINTLNVLFYDAQRKLVRNISGPVSFDSKWENRDDNDDGQAAEHRTPCATFKKVVPSGRYYVYAVANLGINLDDVPTIDALRSVKLTWVKDAITKNIEMLGIFTTDIMQAKNIGFEEDNLITLVPGNTEIHAWARRAVSKVTIDFDGSDLRNNVAVYIKSARIVDIPDGCYLGRKSCVGTADDEFGFGTSVHKLVYGSGTDYRKWPVVARGSGKFDHYMVGDKEVKFHNEYAYSLPCYENMQGVGNSKLSDCDYDGKIDHPGAGNPDHPVDGPYHKDAKPHGTYIEVEGYYVSNNMDYLSSGPIKYRFMLGRNETDNYDVERNHHYKVTMAFRGNGNDVDWHVDYKEKTPEIYTTDVMASYSYNEPVPISVRIAGGKVTSLKARIIENNWHPEENIDGNTYFTNSASLGFQTAWKSDKYFGYIHDGTKHLGNGFLTLYKPQGNVITPPSTYTNGVRQTYAYNQWYWDGKDDASFGGSGGNITNEAGSGKCLGERTYTNGQFYKDETKTETWFRFEAYTRQKCLVKNTGYSGANIYEAGTRIARIELSAMVELDGNMIPVCDTVMVRQTPRVVNPRGIYRSADNNSSFHVNLKKATKEPNSEANIAVAKYEPIKSVGPWRAVIENVGDPGMISLSQYWGDHDSEIDFDVNFNATTKNPSFAIISIWYNDYSCHHRIFVRRGNKPAALVPGGVKWHSSNVSYRTSSKLYDTDDPISEGSLFRYAVLSYAISPKNNFIHAFNTVPSGNFVIKEQTNDGSRTWDNIKITTAGKAPTSLSGYSDLPSYSLIEAYNAGSNNFPTHNTSLTSFKANVNNLMTSLATRPASFDDYYALYVNDDVDYAYGIVYGDSATTTAETLVKAYSYCPDQGNTDGYGMRSVIVYNKTDASNIFFPIGASGYGHRISNHSTANVGKGAMRYAGRGALMASGLAETRPVFWNIMYSKGAIYWLAAPDFNRRMYNGSGSITYSNAWDMNYTSYDFYTYGTDATAGGWANTDAAYIRMVDKP